MAKGKKPARTPWADARAEKYQDIVLDEKPGYDWGRYHRAKEIALAHPTRANLLQWIRVQGKVYVNNPWQPRSELFKHLLKNGEVKLVRESPHANWYVSPSGVRLKNRKFRKGQSMVVLGCTD